MCKSLEVYNTEETNIYMLELDDRIPAVTLADFW